ncbi:MAG: PAS domain S-box protein [Promethearchaeota archaeon]
MEYNRQVIREKFDILFEQSLDLIYVNDLKGNFLDANDIALISLGYEREDIPELRFVDLVEGDELEKAFSALKEILKSGKQSKRREFKLKTKNGNYLYIDTYAIPLKRNGEIYAVLGIGKNITDRIKAEQKLKESEELFRALYKEGPIATYTWQKFENDFVFINFNNAAEKITQGNVVSLLGHRATEMYKDRPDILEDLHQCFNQKINITREMKYKFQLSNEYKYLLVNYGYVRPNLVIVQTEDITEKKKAEENYRNLVENAQEGVWAVDENNDTIFVNPKICEMLGYSKDEMMGKNLDLFLDETMLKLTKTYRKRRVKGLKDTYDLDFIKKDGSVIYTSIKAAPILGENGDFMGSFAYINDITNKKLTEQKLKESEEKFRNIAEQSLLGIAILQDGKFKYVNERFASIAGRSVEELKDWGPGEFLNTIHPEDRKMVAEQSMKKQRGESDAITCYQFRGFKKTGEIVHGETFSKTINYQGRPADFITIIDITDKVEAERKLLESEKKYRFFFENTPFSVVLINSKGRIIECNPTTELMFGYSKEDLEGKKFHKISVIHPDYLPTIMELFQKFIKGERVHRIDLLMYKKDQSLIWVNLQASLVKLEDEYYVQALFTDITRRKEAEYLFNEEITKLKELDHIRKNLISRVAHELKTPLATVCGGAELFSSLYKKKIENEQFELIKLIEKGGERLKYLVDNLIDISRIEYEKFKLKTQYCDLSEVLRESSKEMMHFTKERIITLSLALPDTLFLNIDKIRIEQVLLNLLSNAIKNTPPKGNIDVKLEKSDNWAIISVSDTGVGLTKEEMEILFTRFGKIERYGDGLEYIDIQGSGLGLFISKEIVDLHGGNIRAESEGRNKGSTFIVKLPVN